MSFVPVDHEQRRRAREDHASSLVLTAGAGTGKTTLLVERIVALLRSGHARLDEVAAVTFTENAATTLKLRLREALEALRLDPEASATERVRAERALELLERAALSTIHALCAALLQERPLECGVVPGFRVADETQTDRFFAEAWEGWLAERLTGGDATLLEALDQGIPLEGLGPYGERSSLRGLARMLVDQRDLEPLVEEQPPDVLAWRAALQSRAQRARGLIAKVPEGDVLAAKLQQLVAFSEQAAALEGPALSAHLRRLPKIPANVGLKKHWPSDAALTEGREIARWTGDAPVEWNVAAGSALHGELVRSLLGVVERYTRRKNVDGWLDFVDLLLLARNALRDRPSVRRYFRERWRYLLIDEFQDTDPLQVQIAELLTQGEPGRLVVVGDAKQSIYRFRRAEVSLFTELSERAAREKGFGVLSLTQNFRSRPAILRFVNRVFSELIEESAESGQPAYESLSPPPGLSEDPAVVALGFDAGAEQGAGLVEAEAEALTRFVAEVARGEFEVRDPVDGGLRPSRAGDVMVLTRRLYLVRRLEEALERAALRFTVEGGKSFFDRQEVHEVLAALRAVEDPGDGVARVAALRSGFFGVSDRDIVSYTLSGGRLWASDVDESLPGAEALAPALRLLRRLHGLRTQVSPACLLEQLYDETRIRAALTADRRGEAMIANLEKVVALARQAADLQVLTLRGFARLLEERVESSGEEPDLPVTRPGDPDTLRILTIHRAKGLEAPIVALFDTADDFGGSPSVIPLWREGRVAVGFRKGCRPPDWDRLEREDAARAWAETRRLLYVACTRARDLLVVPRPPGSAKVGRFWKDVIDRLPRVSDADVEVLDAQTLPDPVDPTPQSDLRAIALAAGGDAFAARWDTERESLHREASARRLRPIAATRKAEELARVAEEEAVAGGAASPTEAAVSSPAAVETRRRRRAFGLLVHQVLEWIPLDAARPREVAEGMARALAPRFGLTAEEAGRAAAEIAGVLGLPVMERARQASRLRRELRVWFPEGDDLVEGMVDLVFEEADGLVVVDYKTDRVDEDDALTQADRHKEQLRLYHRGLRQAWDRPVKERLVVFTALGRAVPV